MGTTTILDGGMGKELRRIGAPFRQPEWSALAMLEAPDFVRQAHDNFVAAGAEVLITNVYALVPFHIGAERFAARGQELLTLGGQLAREAADKADRSIQVAGSLPPLFGSYEPESFDADAAVPLWTAFIEEQAPYVDFWIGETMSSVAEFEVLKNLVHQIDGAPGDSRPFWASFCLSDLLSDGRAVLRSGESVTELAKAVAPHQPEAVLFNCSQPEVISQALAELAATDPGYRFGGYANAFQTEVLEGEEYAANTVVLERRDDLTVERYADMVAQWVDTGATIVGGCCDIYPDHIAELVGRFADGSDD